MDKPIENKMGTKPIFSLLMAMSLPAMVSMLIQSLYNIVDSMFVARISEDALTAVSLAFPIQNLIIAVSVGTGVGMNSLISRRLGEKRFDEANSSITHGFILTAIHSILFIILGLILIKPFFEMFTSSQNVIKLGCDYTYVVTLVSFGCLFHILVEKILQATGKMIYPMIFQAVGAIINIILDPILIFGLLGAPALGVTGAAIATIIGQISAMALSVIVFLTQKHEVKIKIKGFKFNIETVKDIYAVAIPSTIMYSLGSILVIGINAILVQFSNLAVALFGIYFKLQSFIFMPVNGLIQGAMPIMGYNFGAKNKKRLLKTLKAAILVSSIISILGTILFVAFPNQLLLMFDASKDMLAIGPMCLGIISTSYVFASICFMYCTIFQAIGKGFYSLIISLLRQGAIIIPLSFILAKPLGLIGVWITFPIAEIISTIVSILMFKHLNKTILSKLD